MEEDAGKGARGDGTAAVFGLLGFVGREGEALAGSVGVWGELGAVAPLTVSGKGMAPEDGGISVADLAPWGTLAVAAGLDSALRRT